MNNKRSPTNTAKEHDPLGFLLNAMTIGSSGAIEHQEAQGQRELVNSEVLPTDINPMDQKALESIGFRFLGPVEGDELFQRVEMPAGWRKQATSHSMWSDLVDDKGRKRGGIFYKAAFYDRKAHMQLNRRYTVQQDYENTTEYVHRIMDGDTVVHAMPPISIPAERRWEASDISANLAGNWLNQNYPDHADITAYWD